MKREDVYKLIDGERDYQDKKWPGNGAPLPMPPSDELRLIRLILSQSDATWYVTLDKEVDGVKVNPADLEAMRKIAAIAVRCMEKFGAPSR